MQGSKHAWLLLIAIVFFGCNQSKDPASTADNDPSSRQPDEETIIVEKVDDDVQQAAKNPKAVVELFLTSLREGDEATTSRLLTNKARMETAKHDMVVHPPGSRTAQFVVGQTIYTTDTRDIAHVESNWTDVDDAGRRQTYEIVWILRKEPLGWAVAGMATELFSGETPLVMNFEDPLDMLAQQQRAELELTRRGAASAGSAQVMPASHSSPLSR
ncbi:hypothetical protein [Blastopirellula marina]|uniref:Uncharacterized protein n=1 Tax=Blastopirellula marina TaxID=124 RepID=A0A2S8G2C4_9BACT|nr:hypothetical protein [Blastopirellula marina]PQO38573.1 hypothetical protein C5Y98_11035 [Blastopirellula marina]PTL45230.1 hypothetical protein C5Y97_11045 [Blastopirellula marina]